NRTFPAYTRHQLSQGLAQSDHRRVGNQTVFDARNFKRRQFRQLFAARDGDACESLKKRLRFFNLVSNSLRGNSLARSRRKFSSQIRIANRVAFPKGQVSNKCQRIDLALTHKSSRGKCNSFNIVRGKKNLGESVAFGRSYRWPPCLASLGNDCVNNNHLEAT